MSNKLHYLIKFGQEEHVKELYSNGIVYMNTIKYFKELESTDGRSDSYEGTTLITNYHKYPDLKVEFQLGESREKIVKMEEVNSFVYRESIDKGNLYSMFAITSNDLKDHANFKLDKRLAKFGTHFLIVFDTKRFVENLKKQFEKLNATVKGDLVHYYDKNNITSQELTLFNKPIEYKYQKEYRFIWFSGLSKPQTIKIGSIKDYSMIFPSTEIETVKLELKKID